MKIQLWSIGKAHDPNLKMAIEEFTRRLSNYHAAEWLIISPPKNAASLSTMEVKKREGELVLQQLKNEDYLVALDEHGKLLSSEGLASFIEQRAVSSVRSLVFLIGGAFGLDEAVLKKAKFSWSLSPLTFPHQLVRLILAEQVYRACTILQNEKYHHQ